MDADKQQPTLRQLEDRLDQIENRWLFHTNEEIAINQEHIMQALVELLKRTEVKNERASR